MRHWSDNLPISACRQAISWARTQPDAETAWCECRRADWMAWLLGYYADEPGSNARKRLALCLSDCIEATAYLADDDIQMVIALCLTIVRDCTEGGTSDLDDVRAAADACIADAYAACAACAAYVNVSAPANTAAYAANTAAYAATRTIRAAGVSAADVSAAGAVCADIIREHYPKPPTLRKSL